MGKNYSEEPIVFGPFPTPLGLMERLAVDAYERFIHDQFKCKRCGKCCTSDNQEGVAVNELETEALAQVLGLQKQDFLLKHTHPVPENERKKRSGKEATSLGHVRLNVPCVFHSLNGCNAYAVRPLPCRMYPLVPRHFNKGRMFCLTVSPACSGHDEVFDIAIGFMNLLRQAKGLPPVKIPAQEDRIRIWQ